MSSIRYISYLTLVVLGACTTTSTDNQSKSGELAGKPSDNAAAVCEIMYAAHPHEKAVAAVGAHRLEQTQVFNFDEMTAFSQAFMPSTQAIAEDVAESSGESLRILEQELVLGGYEGETIPSVVIRASVHGDMGYAALVRMAAQIGYVYAQDSTLVLCPDEPVESWRRVTSVEIVDKGTEEFFKEENVPLFFGMMIGAFNGPERLGYTFYKDSKTFSTLAESERSSTEGSVLEQLSDWLTELSNGDIELAISTRQLWIFFPHNDWRDEPQGGAYIRYMESSEVDPLLEQRRQQYLNDVDRFLSQRKK